MPDRLRIGSRGSALALAQVDLVRPLLESVGFSLDVVIIRTSGDAGHRDRLGAFVGELQEAVRNGSVDIALHCLKDVPTCSDAHLVATLERGPCADVLVTVQGNHSGSMASGSRVATGSLRRTAQLKQLYPDWQFTPLAGNIDSRVERLRAGEFEALVLAEAGLARLGREHTEGVSWVPLDILPAPGQGALVLESRPEDPRNPLFQRLNHPATAAAVLAERTVLAAFGGGCNLPVGALATGDKTLHLRANVTEPHGLGSVMSEAVGPIADPAALASQVAQELIGLGAMRWIDQ